MPRHVLLRSASKQRARQARKQRDGQLTGKKLFSQIYPDWFVAGVYRHAEALANRIHSIFLENITKDKSSIRVLSTIENVMKLKTNPKLNKLL